MLSYGAGVKCLNAAFGPPPTVSIVTPSTSTTTRSSNSTPASSAILSPGFAARSASAIVVPPRSTRISEDSARPRVVVAVVVATSATNCARGKANVEDALARHPDLACVVCLFAYNTPLAIEALKGADKLGEVAIASFDEADETLQGIIDGTVAGTVVQNPFLYGKDSIRVLKGLHNGESLADLGFNEDGFLEIPARTIRKDNVEEFWAELKKNLGEE